MLRLDNLRLRAGSAAHDLQFSPGEITVVLGRNRSGKTNLLRLIAGLDGDASGAVYLDDESWLGLTPGQRSVALVFQAFVNYPHWTVRQNIASPLRARGERGSALNSEVEKIAETLQIGELLERLPAELSGGQQQRLAIGRALAKGAKVLLLDEPFVNLDLRLRELLTLELSELLHAQDVTVVYTTTDCRDAFAIGDQLVLLNDHEVLQIGTPLTVYREPVNLAAADLLSEPGVNSYTDDDVNVVVRPEHMRIEGMPDSVAYPIVVRAVETNGTHTFVQGDCPSRPSASGEAKTWVARLDGIVPVEPGGNIELHVDPRNQIRLAPEDHG